MRGAQAIIVELCSFFVHNVSKNNVFDKVKDISL